MPLPFLLPLLARFPIVGKLPWRLIGVSAVLAVLLIAGLRYRAGLIEAGRDEVRAEWAESIRLAKEKVATTEAEDREDVSDQNDTDRTRIAQLEADLAAERAKPARVVRVRQPAPAGVGSLPSGEGNAGVGQAACPAAVDAGDDAGVDRQALIEFAGVAERLRLAVLSCQEQWPK